MGLGLSICHGIVSALGGEIGMESEVGKGTIAHVKLPPSPACATPRLARASVIPATIVEQARILVVDDEPLIGTSLRRCLSGDHSVNVVRSAPAALELLARGQRFDVILCDLMMPEMTGMELYEELRRSAPDLASKVIFVTGGSVDSATTTFLERVPNQHVRKP